MFADKDMKINETLRNVFLNIVHAFKEIYMLNSSNYRIEEIDADRRIVVLHCRGGVTILKLDISDTINDQSVISKLPPQHACLLGYYYGKTHREYTASTTHSLSKNMNNGFMLQHRIGRFKMHSQDREGTITYFDTKTQEFMSDTPINIARDRFIISNFDPCQACYIGILAGMSTASASEISLQLKQKPRLRLIK